MDEKQFEILTSQLKEIIASLQKLQKDTQQVGSNQVMDALDRRAAERKARREKNSGW